MPSPTITVRFDKELYDKIKNHPLNTSDLIRTSVVQYLRQEENTYNIDPVQTVEHEILHHERQVQQDVQPVKHDYSIENNTFDVPPEKNEDDASITPIMDEIKSKIDELHKEIDSFLDEYDESKDPK